MSVRIPSFLKNKYLIALAVVVVWITFFDKNNLIYQYRLSRQLKELEDSRGFFLEEIRRDSTAIRELRDHPGALERYAREKFLMKRQGEDIFIIVED